MRKGDISSFVVIDQREKDNTTVIKEIASGKTFKMPSIPFSKDDKVDLIVTRKKYDRAKKKSYYYFSQLESTDNKYKHGECYSMHVEEVSENTLLCRCILHGITHKTSDKDQKAKAEVGDNILCLASSIHGNNVSFYVIGNDQNAYHEIGKEYIYPIIAFEKRGESEKNNCVVLFKSISGPAKVYCHDWVYVLNDIIQEILVVYEGNGRWKLVYEDIEHPIFQIGQKYPLKLISHVENGFYKALVNNETDVRVLKPLNSLYDTSIYDTLFYYRYYGIDKNGFLEFRYSVDFKDIISSKALKVIAFDNIRKEYKEDKTFYDKLFSDYDSNSNLWVLSYGKALSTVIENKLLDKEWDNAILLYEVLEQIEDWILKSGFLDSFAPENRENIAFQAEIIIHKAYVSIKALDYVLSGKSDDFIDNLVSEFDEVNLNEVAIDTLFKVLIRVLEIQPDAFKGSLVMILQVILENAGKLEKKPFCDILYSLVRAVEVLVNNIQTKIFEKVFVEPINREKYYTSNTELRFCIQLTIWLIQVYPYNKRILVLNLRLLRYLAYYVPDPDVQELIITKAVCQVYNKKWIPLMNKEFKNIVNVDPLDLVNFFSSNDIENALISNEESGGKSDYAYRYKNQFGYIYANNANLGIILYKESNANLDTTSEYNIIRLANDPVLQKEILTISTRSNLAFDDSIDLFKVFEEKLTVHGIIKNITKFGLFIRVGDKEGLLHSSRVSRNSTDLQKIFNVGDKIQVKIYRIDGDRVEFDRLSVLKEIANTHKYENGDDVIGKVFRVDEQHGAFVELENGANGFIRESNVCINRRPSLSNYFVVGEEVNATVMSNNDKGYELSMISKYSKESIDKVIINDNLYPARVVFINDIFSQIGSRVNIDLEPDIDGTRIFCPKCQKEEYFRSSINNSLSSLDISQDCKSWRCLFCTYKSKKQLILKLVEYPLTVFVNTEDIDIEVANDLIGTEVTVKIEEIDDRFIRASVSDQTELVTAQVNENNISVANGTAIELGFLYEQFSNINSIYRDDLISMCKYYFGFARMARSYFFSFLNEYTSFVKEIQNLPSKEVNSVSARGALLLDYFSSEIKVIETFPVLKYILDQLEIVILMSLKFDDMKAKIFEFTSKENEGIVRLAKLSLAFVSVPVEVIKEDIWNSIKSSLDNNLQLIKEAELENYDLKLRKRIRVILINNKESDQLECKGSYAIPILSKKELLRKKKLEELIEKNNNNGISSPEQEKELEKICDLSINNNKEKLEVVTLSWIKTIAAFANTDGGELIIGIGEDYKGDFELLGLKKDLNKYKGEDGLLLDFDSKFERFIGNTFQHLVKVNFVNMSNGILVMYVKVKKSHKPVFVKYKGQDKFYIRRNVSTSELSLREFSDYKDNRFQ